MTLNFYLLYEKYEYSRLICMYNRKTIHKFNILVSQNII